MNRTVVYDAGVLMGLANRKARIQHEHAQVLRKHVRPLVPGPALAQVWRAGSAAKGALSWHLTVCSVYTGYTVADYKRSGVMLGDVALSGKKSPDVVDALVVLTAARHGPALIVTSDPGDIEAYVATVPKADVTVVPV